MAKRPYELLAFMSRNEAISRFRQKLDALEEELAWSYRCALRRYHGSRGGIGDGELECERFYDLYRPRRDADVNEASAEDISGTS